MPDDTSNADRNQNARLLQIARRAAVAGGKILQSWVGRFSVSEKRRADLVTEADLESQKTVFECIRSEFPDHGFLGEEGLNHESTESPYRWVIDPLDGTSNYVHGFPYYAVSIAVEKDGQTVVGVVFDPTRNESFFAVRGEGAFLNDTPIRTSGETDLSRCMGMASLPVGAGSDDPAVQRFLTSMSHLQTVQRSGSAALNLASVACGRIDAFWSTSLKPWDVAAGILLVEEAGGMVTNLAGGTTDIAVPSHLATCSPTVNDAIVEIFR